MLKKILRGISAALALKKGIWIFSVSSLLVVLLEFPAYTLRVIEATGGRELEAVRLIPGDWLRVEYIHSIYKVKQSEVFKIGSDLQFYLEKVTFGSYAAALYYDAEPFQGPALERDLWMVKGQGKRYSVLKYRVSPSTGHVLHIRNQRFDLSGNSQSPGRLIEIFLEMDKSTHSLELRRWSCE